MSKYSNLGDSSGDINKLCDLNSQTSSQIMMGNLISSSKREEEDEVEERKEEMVVPKLSTKDAAECLLGLAKVTNDTSSAATKTSDTNITQGVKRTREDATTSSSDIKQPPPTKRPTKKNYCKYENCTSQAHKGGVCIKHGAKVKRKLCSHPGCPNQAQRGGICIKHGAKVKLCKFEGCPSQAKKGGVCMRHGAKRKLCIVEGCDNIVQRRGFCNRHDTSNEST